MLPECSNETRETCLKCVELEAIYFEPRRARGCLPLMSESCNIIEGRKWKKRQARERMVMTEWESVFPGGATLIMYHTIQIFITVCPKTRPTDRGCVCVVYMCFYVLLFFHVSAAVIVKSSARHGDEKSCTYEAYDVAHLISWCACCFLFFSIIIIISIAAAPVHHCEPRTSSFLFFLLLFFFFVLFDVSPRDMKERKKRATTAFGDTYGRGHA